MYYLSVFIHIFSAIFWIGGMLFTVAVLVPVSRHQLIANKRGQFFALIGKRFSRISWVLFIILIITGITNLLARGFSISDLTTSTFWNSFFGSTLSVKLHLFGAVLILSGLHDFYTGPKAADLMDKEPESDRTTRMRNQLAGTN